MQSKIDERRTGKNLGLHNVMPWRTVRSESQFWCTHSSLLIPRFLSSRLPASAIYPFTRLYLCFSDEDKRKHSIICPPFLSLILSRGLFRQGSQAWLAIVTWPHGGKIGTHAPRRSWARARTKKKKCMSRHTNVARRRTKVSFAWSDCPLSKAQWGRDGRKWAI